MRHHGGAESEPMYLCIEPKVRKYQLTREYHEDCLFSWYGLIGLTHV